MPDGTGPDILSHGFGLRAVKNRNLAYWEIDMQNGKLIRQPLDVLNWRTTTRCHQPVIGE
ncbi:hypothetical protein [Bradyrhizobium sp. WD16]|uniref:hypothetical protein n=1 Tax=Bradyrhizobium sp. WD16 TaxID=1521768 RepID=UPI0020A3580F|nr:hypothetical protein [Bradyrhizobium sp. WD16]